MDYRDLYPFVLVLVAVGMLLGVGLLTLGAFSDAARDTNDLENETVANPTFNIGNTSVITVANTPIESILRITNTSNYVLVDQVDYNATDGNNGTAFATGKIAVYNRSGAFNEGVNVSYGYYADSEATTATDSMVTASKGIATTWMALIVTIVVLSIILGLVIRSFATKR